MAANSANSTINVATTQGNDVFDFHAATIGTLNITVADNATFNLDNAAATATITSGAITTANLTLGNYATWQDKDADSDDDLSISGAVTTANVHYRSRCCERCER